MKDIFIIFSSYFRRSSKFANQTIERQQTFVKIKNSFDITRQMLGEFSCVIFKSHFHIYKGSSVVYCHSNIVCLYLLPWGRDQPFFGITGVQFFWIKLKPARKHKCFKCWWLALAEQKTITKPMITFFLNHGRSEGLGTWGNSSHLRIVETIWIIEGFTSKVYY